MTGIKSGLPCVVVFVTKSTMAFLEAPSFQEWSGSVATLVESAAAVSDESDRWHDIITNSNKKLEISVDRIFIAI